MMTVARYCMCENVTVVLVNCVTMVTVITDDEMLCACGYHSCLVGLRRIGYSECELLCHLR